MKHHGITIFEGPDGSGKTTAALALARERAPSTPTTASTEVPAKRLWSAFTSRQ